MIDQFVGDLIYVLFIAWIGLAAAAFVIIALASALMRGFRKRRGCGDG